MALTLDTSVLLAALDAADPDHGACAELIAEATENLIVPALVLSELDYWCQERLGGAAWLAFLEDLLTRRSAATCPRHPSTSPRSRAMLRT